MNYSTSKLKLLPSKYYLGSNETNTDILKQIGTKFNLFIPSTESCNESNTKVFCNFASFLIFCGYLLHMFIFPLIIIRMRDLKTRFRNQYSISILWLCSIMLITSIDLIEFILLGDQRVFSVFICIFICVYLLTCILAVALYMKNYSIDGTHYQNALAILFSASIFLIILFARFWSHKTFKKYSIKSKETSSFAFYALNTYFFLYYFCYVLFGAVQIYQNFKNHFAKSLTNHCYGSWVLGAFFLSFYSAILPKNAHFDYIHYKNYFLMTTIIIIILQELNFIRLRLYRNEKRNNINAICMKQFNVNVKNGIYRGNTYQSFKLNLDKAFGEENRHSFGSKTSITNESIDEEEVVFERPELSNGLSSTRPNQKTNNNQIPELSVETSLNDNFRHTRFYKFERLINNNQTKLIILFVILMILQLVISTVILFRSVTFSYYKIVTPFVHPIVIIFSLVFKDYSCNFNKNDIN